jgi:hypothetical protein
MTMETGGERLRPRAFDPLPLGAVRPAGWLRRQLEIQATGLSGHLDEFWPDVADSAWIGGTADGWERGPYWLDGVVPLAYLLGDARLQAKVTRWVDAILAGQDEDGWLGTAADKRIRGDGSVDLSHAYDPWPRFVVLKALTQYQEATGDPRIVPALIRFLRRLQMLAKTQALRSWGRSRWADLVVSIHWLYERTGEHWLLELASEMYRQGYDWRGHAVRFPVHGRCLPEERDLSTHVVNNAMGIKAPGVWFRQSSDAADADASLALLAALDRWHGQATGMFSGDEHLAGRNPSQGTELCAVAETMYSLEVLLGILGEATLGDRLETIAFNALPATISRDMWSHQYVQQVNQVQCAVCEDRVYTSNGPDANIFGLEPHFGCCLANMHQAWPKLASHLWMRRPDGGLAAMVLAPCTVETTMHGVGVRIAVETAYPFGDRVEITVAATEPVTFALDVRIPDWAEGATVVLDGATEGATPGGFHTVMRQWKGETWLTLELPMPIRHESRDGNAVIGRGPLLFAMPIAGEWRRLRGEDPHADWEVLPTARWNVGLVRGADVRVIENEPPVDVPFGDTVALEAQGRRVAGWDMAHGAAGPVPVPAQGEGDVFPVRLVPYGSTTLRIAQFPVVSAPAGK